MKYLFVDFDNTIVKTNKRCVQLLNSRYNKHVNYHTIQKYDFSDKFPEASTEEIDSLFTSSRLYEDIEMYPQVAKCLFEISHWLKVRIVTIGSKENLRLKKVWCSWNLPFVEDIIGIEDDGCHNKSSIDMSNGIFIDDHVECLRSSNSPCKFLFYSQPIGEWQRMGIEDKFYVSDDWSQITQYIKEMIIF